MSNPILEKLGPLRPLVGTWEGGSGLDIGPSAAREVEETKFRERMVFEPFGPAENHEQVLYGLRYHLQAWRDPGEGDPFHDEIGYWYWDAKNKWIMKSLTIPRAMVVLAGGTCAADAKKFKVSARVGNGTFGILSNPFLEEEFKTVLFDQEIEVRDDGTLAYAENTVMLLKGRTQLFEHKDRNVLKKVKD